MLATALIVFREILEATLIVSIQVLFYGATLILIGGFMQMFGKHVPATNKTPPQALTYTAVVLLAVSLGTLGGALGAQAADFQVRSPIVDYRELEFEHNGAVTFDKKDSDLNNNQSYTYTVGVGVTPFWFLEVEGDTVATPETTLRYSATTLENTFQLTPQGKYWADLGFFVEYFQSAQRNEPNAIEFGPIVQKEAPGFLNSSTLHTLNVFFEKELGHNRSDDTGFTYAWQSRLRLNPLFEPGVELYGNIEDIANPGKFSEQQHRIGPMFAGLSDSER